MTNKTDLSKRQHECVLLYLKGYTRDETAHALGISSAMVAVALSEARQVWQIGSTRQELVEKAHQEGIK